MGWNSWNCFGTNTSENKIMGIADAMVSSGMKDAGYSYIVIDDGWREVSSGINIGKYHSLRKRQNIVFFP
jgi:hypothetical protein